MKTSMINSTGRNSLLPVFILILIAGFTRLIPHPFNFTAIGAMALFAGSRIPDRRLAYLIPLTALFISDIFIGFHSGMYLIYGLFLFNVWIGTKAGMSAGLPKLLLYSLFGSVVFFLVSNLPVFYMDIQLYPLSLEGTIASYTAAIPFFKNQIAGDLFYTSALYLTHSVLIKSELKTTF